MILKYLLIWKLIGQQIEKKKKKLLIEQVYYKIKHIRTIKTWNQWNNSFLKWGLKGYITIKDDLLELINFL